MKVTTQSVIVTEKVVVIESEIEFMDGTVFWSVDGAESREYSLREFLNKARITKEDCLKAFEEKES